MKSSAQACFDVSLTKSLLSTQSLARFEARSKEERKGSFLELGGTLAKALVDWNEWAMVRLREDEYIKVQLKNDRYSGNQNFG